MEKHVETILSSFLGTLAMAGGQGGQGGQGAGGGLEMILMLVVMFGLMYFMVMRPQQKREKERREMQKRIKAGDSVRTIGGILGTVTAVTEKTVTVCVCDKTNIEFVREAVNLRDDETDDKGKKAGDAEKK